VLNYYIINSKADKCRENVANSTRLVADFHNLHFNAKEKDMKGQGHDLKTATKSGFNLIPG
jgi:hypothetical protein